MKIAVLGGGESGVGAALLAQKKGYEVWLSDRGKIKEKYRTVLSNNAIDYEEGMHSESRILAADEVIVSPGIPEKAPIMKALRKANKSVIGEIEFAGRYTNAKMVGITGSNGKTTTTLLIHHIFVKAGFNVGLAGNIGKSLAAQLAEGAEYDLYVLEISSFQLDTLVDFKLDVAVLLNITHDHLDRYDYDLMKYARSKMRIARNQDNNDYFIYNADDPVIAAAMKNETLHGQQLQFSIESDNTDLSAYRNNNKIIINHHHNPLTMTIQELALQGKHNLYNSMAAGIASRILEVKKEIIRECLSDFQNIEHRLEKVNSVCGITFINDSKATNVNSAWYALESMSEPTVWIVGGVDKGNDYTQLAEMVKQKVKVIVCLGVDNTKIHEAFEGMVETIIDTNNMRDAVISAYQNASKGDTVLLSPACASFDLFQDYEDRGHQFKDAVRHL